MRSPMVATVGWQLDVFLGLADTLAHPGEITKLQGQSSIK